MKWRATECYHLQLGLHNQDCEPEGFCVECYWRIKCGYSACTETNARLKLAIKCNQPGCMHIGLHLVCFRKMNPSVRASVLAFAYAWSGSSCLWVCLCIYTGFQSRLFTVWSPTYNTALQQHQTWCTVRSTPEICITCMEVPML